MESFEDAGVEALRESRDEEGFFFYRSDESSYSFTEVDFGVDSDI